MLRGTLNPSYALETSAWVAGAHLTNPGAGDVWVETPALVKGKYIASFVFNVTTGGAEKVVDIVLRNAADSADIYTLEFHIKIDITTPFDVAIPVDVNTGEKFKIRGVSAVVGHAQGVIGYAKVVI